MRSKWLVRLCCFVIVLQCVASSAWAYKRENRIPLMGCRGHYAASGSAHYVIVRNVPKEKDREEFIVDIRNVPLRPGTILVVFVNDESVGKITLNAKQSGNLTLTTESNRFIPPLDPGTTVVLKTVDGKMVTW